MPTPSDVKVTPGSGKNVATYAFTGEDSETKELQRVTLNKSDGSEIDLSLGQKATTSSQSVVPASDSPNFPVAQVSVAFDVQTSIARPNNTTAYSANDVVGGALDLGVLGPSGGAVIITGAQLELDISAIPSGMTSFRLYLYNVTPPSAVADNGAWDLPTGDRASFLGYIDLGTPVDLGSTCYSEVTGLTLGNKQVKLSGTHLFGYLVTNAGYIPAVGSETYKITLHTVSV